MSILQQTARWLVDPETKWRHPPQFVLDSWGPNINVCRQTDRDSVCSFLLYWLKINIQPFALFHHSVWIVSGSLWCFTVEVEDPMQTEQRFVIWSRIRIKGKVARE